MSTYIDPTRALVALQEHIDNLQNTVNELWGRLNYLEREIGKTNERIEQATAAPGEVRGLA